MPSDELAKRMPRALKPNDVFGDFDQERWYEWIEDALLEKYRIVEVLRDESADDYISRVFLSINPQIRRGFSRALADVIESTPVFPSEAQRLAVLVRVAQVAKPNSAPLIRRFLADGVGKFEIEESGSKRFLQNVLLVTAGKYGVDSWLREYIFRSVDQYRSFEYALLCMRVLVWKMDSSAFSFHHHLIPRFEKVVHARQYGLELEIALRKLSVKLFHTWYSRFSVSPEWPPEAVALWKTGMSSALRAVPTEPYSHVLVAELKAENREIDLPAIYAVANTPGDIREGDIVSALNRIRRTYAFEILTSETAVVKMALGDGAYLAAGGETVELNEASPATSRLSKAVGHS